MTGSRARHLVTTSLEEAWPEEGPVLFLGEWCRRFSRRERWSDMDAEVVPYHWRSRETLDADYRMLCARYESLLGDLRTCLNDLHGVDHGLRYWRILVGPWLLRILHMAFDRWAALEEATDHYGNLRTIVLEAERYSLVADDVEATCSRAVTPFGNHVFFDLLLTNSERDSLVERIVRERQAEDESPSPASGVQRRFTLRALREKALLTYSDVGAAFMRDDDVMIAGSKMPWYRDVRLAAGLRQFPQYWARMPRPPSRPADPGLREGLGLGEGTDEFGELIRRVLPDLMPSAYLEGYGALVDQVSELPWPSAPKAIWTCRDWRDEVFKAYAAEKTEDGSVLVMSQQSGQYGVFPWYTQEENELLISDRYLTWGWEEPDEPKARPVGYVRARRSLGVDHPSQPNGMLVTWAVDSPIHIALPVINSTVWLDYFEDHCRFVDALPPDVRDAFVVRLYRVDAGWDQEERWKDRFPGLRVDAGHSDVEALTSTCRLLVSTYNGTNNLEALAMGVPTVMFWDPVVWPLRDSARPYFELLQEVGIFHETPESAAAHVSEVWQDVGAWWHSAEVVDAVKRFNSRFIDTPRDLVGRTAAEIKDAVREAS